MPVQGKRIKPKFLFSFLLVALCFLFSPIPVSANSPVPGSGILIEFDKKLPDEVAFVDLLIPLAADSADYEEYNSNNGNKYGIARDSQVVNYDDGGFVSYAFHFAGASSGMVIEGPEYGTYYHCAFETGLDDLEGKVGAVKVAFLNDKGAILHVTESIQISSTLTGYFTGIIKIDPATFEVTDTGHYTSPWMVILLPFRIIPRVAFSVLTETFIAYLFKITPLKKVVLLNIATQFALTLFMTTTSMDYWRSLIIGETAVYLIEGIVLLLMYKEIKKGRLLLFVLVANTVTLCFGLLLNYMGAFRH